MASGTGAAHAAAGDGTLTVQVLRDFFGTGVINATMDTPQQGMAVGVSDAAGHEVQGVTDATGKFVMSSSTVLAGGQYRVDVTVPAAYAGYLQAAPASTAANHFDSFTSFVDLAAGKDASVITGVWNPADYTNPDHKYYVPVQTPAVSTSGTPADPQGRALVAVDPAARGTCTPPTNCPTVLNTQGEVGTTWGLAYDKYQNRIFQSAFAKRYTTYGPAGGGAIYTTPADGSSAPKLFADLLDAAPTGHGLLVDMRKDPNFVDVPGKEGVGGIALSEDGKTLYAVDLATRSLATFDATGGTGAFKDSVTIPAPTAAGSACAADSDWRPFAVTVHDAKVYVGGVCDAESTNQRSDLRAVVYVYDGKNFTQILSQPLDYQRGWVINGVTTPLSDHWNPWETSLSTWDQRYGYSDVYIDPQPELASLAFTRDGSMILGFRDRFMDVIGAGGLDPRPGNNTPEQGMSGGAIDMACSAPGNTYDWEGTGDCPNNATYANDGHKPAGVVQYFPGDFFDPGHTGQGAHEDASQGSAAYVPQQQFVVSTELDPALQVSSDGLGYYDVKTGLGPGQDDPANGYQFVSPSDNAFGKAGGLGDIAYTAANAPIQIGNYVWFDGDHNGVQDAHSTNEVPLAGATVNLLDAGGKQVASTTTDAAGEYYFGGVGAKYQLTPGAKYTVEFNVCTAKTDNVPSQPAATALRFTLPLVGTDRTHDSNVVPPTTGQLCDGFAPVTAPANPGGVDHTIDAGVYIPAPAPPPTSPSSTPTTTPTSKPSTTPSTSRSTTPTPPPTTPPTTETSGSGGLAHTGMSSALPELAMISVLLLSAGGAIAWGSRHRRAGRH
ncbi:SdrD B-like domain-containing protein [Catenulispora sp. EB89]|uniref:SdrD B-like domain-containing protein n=1 Tax=Catenulispora sp. EB89 TaxID=3156257 RepID=UPI003514C57A